MHKISKKPLQARDRIAQAYLGLWGDEETQEKARRRIDWLAGQAEGGKVLDVGCSEGILPLILARTGFDVVGVDINADALAYAEELLGKELESVRSKVTFIHGDLLNAELEESSFDTVILGEVLEHLLQPEPVLRKACSFLKPGGRILVTTPFGYFPDPDHKQTFALSDVISLLKPFVSPGHLSIEDDYIRFAGRNKANDAAGWSYFDDSFLLKISEQATIDQQILLRDRVDYWKTAEDKSKKQFEQYKKTSKDLEAQLGLSQKERKDLEAQLGLSQKERKDLEAQLGLSQKERKDLEAQLGLSQKEQEELKVKLSVLQLSLNKTVWNYRKARHRLLKIKQSTSYKLGQILIKAVSYPGKNTISLPIRLARLISLGLSRRAKASSPALYAILCKLPNGDQETIPFIANKPDHVIYSKNMLTFNLSKKEAVYLISKENTNFNKPPNKNTFSLAPNTYYEISGTIRCEGNVFLLLIEYDEEKRLQDHKIDNLSSGAFKLNFKTSPEHKKMSIGIRLAEKGLIKITDKDYWEIKAIEPSFPGKKHSRKIDFTSKSDLRVAGIMDEFNFNSFRYECNLLQLTPENWFKEICEFKPHILFVESAWRGKEDKWNQKISRISTELAVILEFCNDFNIPTVFWNKEDPVHFETFINTASKFDHVFTTDIDCISRYKEVLGHNNVYLLPFACQPAIHNSIEEFERKDKLCFAGAYYARYTERQRDIRTIIDHLAQLKEIEIYDRNYGGTDSRYMFPEEYKPYIIGNLAYSDINAAYKGYRYNINMNSIKYSQSMFARRVFELLASNTTTISNYSRGMRLLFSDLVISSDDGEELKCRFGRIAGDELYRRKLRLAGLRKVLQEHTCENRLNYIVQKVFDKSFAGTLPQITVIALAASDEELSQTVENFYRQNYKQKTLAIIKAVNFNSGNPPESAGISLYTLEEAENMKFEDLITEGFVAAMMPEDYYGANYLQDLALATHYSQSKIIGKRSCYVFLDSGIKLQYDGNQYKYVDSLAMRSAMVHSDLIKKENIVGWVKSIREKESGEEICFSVDEFNYCKYGAHNDCSIVNDLEKLNAGISIEQLYQTAEEIQPTNKDHQHQKEHITGREMTKWLRIGKHKAVTLANDGDSLSVKSDLQDGQHQYLYSSNKFTKEDFGFSDIAKFNLEATAALEICLVFLFLDNEGQRLGHAIALANRNHIADIPKGTKWIQMGLRVRDSGHCLVKKIILDHMDFAPGCIFSTAPYLLITSNYPEYTNLYKNAFVHRRVIQYKQCGIDVDVFRFNRLTPSGFYEFEDIDVISGYQNELKQVLTGQEHKIALVHFLDEHIWEVLQDYIDKTKIIIWIHGSEIHPWHRREHNFQKEKEKQQAIESSNRRFNFWSKFFANPHPNIHLVFVSQYFANEVMEDYRADWPKEQYSIIHNFIDTDLFSYKSKQSEQRKKILSIRPYDNNNYANDLSVKAILELSKKPYFHELSFRIIGNGRLFDETVAPLWGFPNVIIEKRFLRQKEIAGLHKEYGVFMCPSRMDTQGVSRDEAMASGLVPLTTRIAAIPEFVDDSCGILVEPEDASALAEAIHKLYSNPLLFQSLSKNAAKRVRNQSSYKQTIMKEINLIQSLKNDAETNSIKQIAL